MATEPPSPPARTKPARIGRFKIGLNVIVQCLLAVLVLGMLNILSFNHYKRWDYTRTHFYSLSDKTLRVLGGLKSKVKAYLFFPKGSVIATDVNNLLKEYQYRSNGKLEVEYVDPYRDQARAQELQNTYKLGPDQNVIILDSGGRVKRIGERSMVNLDTSGEQYNQGDRIISFKGEETVTGALLTVTDDKPNILYSITGHGERDITGEDYAGIKSYIEQENVKVQPLNLEAGDSIPQDAGIIFIAGARFDFSDSEIKMLGDYWEKKGRLFVLLDPAARKLTPKLVAFLAAQGVRPEDDRILRVERTQVQAIAALVKDVTGGYIEGSPITQSLKNTGALFLGATQSLTLDAARARLAGTQLRMLVQAGDGYWGERDYNIKEGDPVPVFLPSKDFGQPLAVAVSVEKGALKDSQVQVDTSRMVVVGNCEFISKQSLTGPNVDFIDNAVYWLLDRAELIGIAPKDYTSLTLNLTQEQLSDILTTTTFFIPAVVGVLALGLWWKRRH